MNRTRLPMKTWVALTIIAGLLALALYIYYIVGFGNVVEQIGKTNPYYYSAAFMAITANIAFFSLAWRSLLANLSIRITRRQAFLYICAGMFVDSLVPEPANVTGDLVKSYLVSKATGESSGKTTASAIGQRALGILIAVGNLVAGLILLAFHYYLLSGILLFTLAVLALLAVSLVTLYYIGTRRWATKRILYALIRFFAFLQRGKWDSAQMQTRAESLLNAFHDGVKTLTAKPKALIRPVLFSVLSWAFDVSAVFLVFTSIGYSITPDKVFIVYALTGGLQAMGISFIGLTEMITSALYTVLSIPLAISLTATILTRFITFWFKLIIAYVAFQYAGIKLLLNQTPLNNSPEN